MSPGVSLVEVNVNISIVEVVEGPHVVGQGGLTLDEGVVGEPHAVPVLTLTSWLQTLYKNTLNSILNRGPKLQRGSFLNVPVFPPWSNHGLGQTMFA